uniref:Uncharacterized protein n=1 Tax=Candidatus Kentrum sp. LPFa TaxID=2126335 RepID=A0A450VWU0_9GAMM|nr:MAG: hypothetical protein BECKLPF1236B_GA0070989_10077 [Candidatus Kentron sp. LPFa]
MPESRPIPFQSLARSASMSLHRGSASFQFFRIEGVYFVDYLSHVDEVELPQNVKGTLHLFGNYL